MPAKKKALANARAKVKAKAAAAKKARPQLKAKAAKVKAAVKKAPAKAAAKVKAAAKKAAPAKKRVPGVPEGFSTITANLCVNNCAEAIEFYKRAFGAKEIGRMTMDGSPMVWHAHLKIGDSSIFLNDPMPGGGPASSVQNPSPVQLHLYVDDCDKWMQRAVDAGLKVTMPMMDAFWGDRIGGGIDPYGNQWNFSSQKKILSMKEIEAGGKAFAAQMASAPPPPPASTQGNSSGALA